YDQVSVFDYALNPTDVQSLQSGLSTPLQGVNQPACDGVDRACNGSVNTRCKDGDQCTTGDICNGTQCVGGSAALCSSSSECATATCNPKLGACEETPRNGGTCDDGRACTTNDTCVAGRCQGTETTTCGTNTATM